jgi:FAD-dependent urate hydroxylase
VKEIKPVGAAISIWPNGVKCMKHLGMGDIMETYGGPMHFLAYIICAARTDPVQPRAAGRTHRRPPLPGFPRRAAARNARLLGTRRVQFGKRVTRCEENADGVRVWFTDGSMAAAIF